MLQRIRTSRLSLKNSLCGQLSDVEVMYELLVELTKECYLEAYSQPYTLNPKPETRNPKP